MEFGPVEAQDAVNFARSEAENERLRSRIAGLEEQLRCCLRTQDSQVPCTCDEPVSARPVECLRHQIVRARPWWAED